MRALITIAGRDIPDPSTYSGTTSTVVDSARNVEGYFIGSVIRDDMAKVEVSWSFIEAQQWANILTLFSRVRGGSFINNVTFFCQDTNDWETREMYINDRNSSLFKRNPDGSIAGYLGAKLALIEV